MNRKHTILIAVIVNASLLVVLFIAALTTPEEVFIASSVQITEPSSAIPIELALEPSKPLFTEVSDQTLRHCSEPEKKTESIVAVETSVLHPLPSRTQEPTPIEMPPLAEAPRPAPVLSPDYKEISIKKGDSLDKLAKEHQTSVSELIKLNRLPSSFLRIGQQIKVPVRKKPLAAPKTLAPVAEEEYYTIKVGDNPWSIALKHHIKVEELLRLNGLNEEKARKLKPGDRLRIRSR
jgi:LysM repeat protein